MSSPNLDVRYVAQLARIELTEEEVEQFSGQLSRVLEYVDQLKQLDVEGVEPTAHTSPQFNVFREDSIRASLPREAALSNAPRSANNLIIVPKVVE